MSRRSDPPSRERGGKAPGSTPEAKLRLGLFVFGTLMVMEVLEYALGVSMKSGSWPFLAVLAVIAAWPIVHYFMHIMQLKRPEE